MNQYINESDRDFGGGCDFFHMSFPSAAHPLSTKWKVKTTFSCTKTARITLTAFYFSYNVSLKLAPQAYVLT